MRNLCCTLENHIGWEFMVIARFITEKNQLVPCSKKYQYIFLAFFSAKYVKHAIILHSLLLYQELWNTATIGTTLRSIFLLNQNTRILFYGKPGQRQKYVPISLLYGVERYIRQKLSKEAYFTRIFETFFYARDTIYLRVVYLCTLYNIRSILRFLRLAFYHRTTDACKPCYDSFIFLSVRSLNMLFVFKKVVLFPWELWETDDHKLRKRTSEEITCTIPLTHEMIHMLHKREREKLTSKLDERKKNCCTRTPSFHSSCW